MHVLLLTIQESLYAGIIRCKPNPPMGVTTYVTHSESLASVLISKSTCGIFMLFIAFGIACNHHFNSFVAKVLRMFLLQNFKMLSFKNSFFYVITFTSAERR